MRPSQLHAVLSSEDAIVEGGFMLIPSLLRESLFGVIHTATSSGHGTNTGISVPLAVL